VLQVEAREQLQLRRLENSAHQKECGDSVIVVAGAVVGNLFTVAGVVDAVGALAIFPD